MSDLFLRISYDNAIDVKDSVNQIRKYLKHLNKINTCSVFKIGKKSKRRSHVSIKINNVIV